MIIYLWSLHARQNLHPNPLPSPSPSTQTLLLLPLKCYRPLRKSTQRWLPWQKEKKCGHRIGWSTRLRRRHETANLSKRRRKNDRKGCFQNLWVWFGNSVELVRNWSYKGDGHWRRPKDKELRHSKIFEVASSKAPLFDVGGRSHKESNWGRKSKKYLPMMVKSDNIFLNLPSTLFSSISPFSPPFISFSAHYIQELRLHLIIT